MLLKAQQLIKNFYGLNKIQVSPLSDLTCKGTLLKTTINMTGCNQILIEENTQLLKISMRIQGENNQINIGSDCHVENYILKVSDPFDD
ncbi:MAG: hypothetical protein Q9M50_13185 [Methylococcales bacterium]|nr:hypothetical protein [Methylococcales bacterium]